MCLQENIGKYLVAAGLKTPCLRSVERRMLGRKNQFLKGAVLVQRTVNVATGGP